MGVTPSNPLSPTLTTKFIQSLQDPNFGPIDIYKTQQGKYIMMLRRTFMKDDHGNYSNDFGFHDIMQYIRSAGQNGYFTPILYVQSKVETLCMVYEVMELYCEYYNFTLGDMIRHKKEMDSEELWLCFAWLLRYACLLRKKQWTMPEGITLDRIFITLKGMPTVSIHHVIKNSDNDVLKQSQNQCSMIKEVCMCVLQLACMTFVAEGDSLELWLRKAAKVDQLLGEVLAAVLSPSMRDPGVLGEAEVLERVERLLAEGRIALAREIKLNKFRYVIPKPEVMTEQSSQKQPQPQPLIKVNPLLGKKTQHNLSLRDSNTRPQPLPLTTPMNKTLSIKSTLLLDQLEYRKQETLKQKQKLTERKQQMMKNTGRKSVNKENLIGNSIGQVRPSCGRKATWGKGEGRR